MMPFTVMHRLNHKIYLVFNCIYVSDGGCLDVWWYMSDVNTGKMQVIKTDRLFDNFTFKGIQT